MAGVHPHSLARVCSEVARGIFAPLLTNAGLPIVDGAAAFSWVKLPGAGDGPPHPMFNIGEHYRCGGRPWLQGPALPLAPRTPALSSNCAGVGPISIERGLQRADAITRAALQL